MRTAVSFLREAREEFTKVTWPTRRETIRLTVVVIIISAIFGIYVGGLDFLFTNLMNMLIKGN